MATVNGNGEGSVVHGEDWTAEVNMDEFYTDAAKYWEGIPATVDGMLGGYGNLSSTDIAESRKFILPLIEGPQALVSPNRALDCGAGIGRVSKRLLIPLFSEVDLVEQNASFLEKAKVYLGDHMQKVVRFYPVGLQDFTPEPQRYDVIWCQWVLSHLTDEDLKGFLQRCIVGMSPGGLIVAKENIASGTDIFDEEDSSVTRTFAEAGLRVVRQRNQKKFPKEFFQVTMFALGKEPLTPS